MKPMCICGIKPFQKGEIGLLEIQYGIADKFIVMYTTYLSTPQTHCRHIIALLAIFLNNFFA